MEALTLDRSIYDNTLAKIEEDLHGESYVNEFKVTFPDGINTANTLEICRVVTEPTFANKKHLMGVCIEGKLVEVECPNGDREKFCMSSQNDNLEGIPLFKNDPLALIAIMDSLYGYILKKYVRLSKPEGAAATAE
ncbi:MAG: hypothetical protein J6W46_00260 [Spirochaetaceae bacterium]|nr:hypothetical protein [Spirochaetaceae bacterium]